MKINTSLVKAIILLPLNVMIFIPCLILLTTDSLNWGCGFSFPSVLLLYGLGIIIVIPALFIMYMTVKLFVTKGEGTPAPWNPPEKFVVAGPYRYVRNPMLIGVLIVLLVEAIILGSFPIFIFWLVFLFANMIYFPFFEEQNLAKRFGEDYLQYKKNVPRWIPRIRPWIK